MKSIERKETHYTLGSSTIFCKKIGDEKIDQFSDLNKIIKADTIKRKISEEKTEIENYKIKLQKIIKKNKELTKKLQILAKKERKSQIENSKIFKNILKRGLKKKNSNNLNKIQKKIQPNKIFFKIKTNLTSQILEFYKSIKKYHKYKTKTFKKTEILVQDVIKKFFNNKINSKIRGSFEIGLFMPISDLNITVSNTTLIKSKKHFNSLIKDFQKTLKKNADYKVLLFTQNTSVSVIKIKLIKKTTFPNIEICFKFNEKNKIKHNEEIMVEYLRLYPISRILYFVLKQMLYNEKISLPYLYGLNSFSTFLIIIHFLEIENFPQKEKLDFEDPEKFGAVLIKMFFYFAYKFDFYNSVILTQKISNFENAYFGRNKKGKLTILNPLKPDIVITNSFKKTDELKFFFKKFYIKFFQNYEETSLKIEKKKEKKNSLTNNQKNTKLPKENKIIIQKNKVNTKDLASKVEDKENFCCKQKINSRSK